MTWKVFRIETGGEVELISAWTEEVYAETVVLFLFY